MSAGDLVPRLPALAEETIVAFLRGHALYHGNDGGVVGLSGGIDSALVAHLAAQALGPHRVLGVLLPDPECPPSLRQETEAFADSLGIERRTLPIGAIEAEFRTILPEVSDRVTRGNTKARIRMIVLYALARERHRVVLGTGNKSELLLGYFTKYGDGGVDVQPIADLYKTEVRELAAQRGVPAAIRDRPPSAGLWEGQTDEEELGLPYDAIDRILRGLELGLGPEELPRRTGLAPTAIEPILARVRASRHKRHLPPVAAVSKRTVGAAWDV